MDVVPVILLLVVLVAETVLSATWKKVYFTRGIVIFAKKSSVDSAMIQGKSASAFQLHFDNIFRGQRMLFREIEPGVVAFREEMVEFRFMALRYPPIMHGIVAVESGIGKPVVKGMLNWTVVAFFGIFLWISLGALNASLLSLVFPLLAAFMVMLIYWIQYRRYKKILDFAST